MDHLVHLDHPDHLDHLNHLNHLDHLDHLDYLDHLDHMDYMEFALLTWSSLSFIIYSLCASTDISAEHAVHSFQLLTNKLWITSKWAFLHIIRTAIVQHILLAPSEMQCIVA